MNRWAWVGILVILVLVLMAGVGSLVSRRSSSNATSQPVVINSIILGTLRSASDTKKPNPRLLQKESYETGEPLALRVMTPQTLTQPLTLSVRLLTSAGQVYELQPSQLTIAAGTTSFCCWQITQVGSYRLQIFRPDNTVTAIPLTITKGSAPPSGAGGFFNIF